MCLEILEQYKNISIKIIEYIKNDDDCDELMNIREKTIEDIVSGQYPKEKIKYLYNNLEIYKVDSQLEEIIKEKLKETKEAIKKAVKGKQAINGYNSTRNKLNFYSVKI